MNIGTEDSGQALIELSLTAAILCVFVFGIVDFSRAIYDVEVMQNLSGEGSSMASRGTSPAKTAQSIVTYAGTTLDMSTAGCVIVTVVTNNGAATNPLQVTAQGSQCNIAATSKIGCLQGQSGCKSSNATLPVEASAALQANQNLYVTEVFYTYTTITPVMNLLGSSVVPAQLYSAAYY